MCIRDRIGSDSHTPTGGGIGMLAMGAGGLDVAVAMGGGAYYITMPKMYKVNLTGKLRDFVTAKDVSLEILRILSVKGDVYKRQVKSSRPQTRQRMRSKHYLKL